MSKSWLEKLMEQITSNRILTHPRQDRVSAMVEERKTAQLELVKAIEELSAARARSRRHDTA